MSAGAYPTLSVLLPADRFDTIREVVERLRSQTIRDQLELVIVTPSAQALGLDDSAQEGFFAVRIVEVGSLDSLPRARAKGVIAASAPIVALGETHSFPDPDWAAALVEAHRGPWVVVGPAISNANPESMISWANIFMDYGPWVESKQRGTTDNLPGHNSSFKRAVLLGYGDELEYMMQSDTVLIEDVKARGHGLYLESAARTAHLNVTRPTSWFVERFSTGWLFASLRARRWPWARRLVYALGSPLIPAVRFQRILRDMRRSGRAADILPGVLPALAVGLITQSAGECFGYALGRAPTRRLYEMELHRARYVTPQRDRSNRAPRARAGDTRS